MGWVETKQQTSHDPWSQQGSDVICAQSPPHIPRPSPCPHKLPLDPYPARGLRGCCRALARAMGEAGMGVSASRAGAPDGGRKGGGVPAGIPEVSGRQAGLGWADNSSRLWVPPACRGVSQGPGHPPPHVWDPARYAPVTSPGGPAAGEPNKLQTRGRSRALGNTPSAGSEPQLWVPVCVTLGHAGKVQGLGI